MCEFQARTVKKNSCEDRTCDQYDKFNLKASKNNEGICPLCEDKPSTSVYYDPESCGLAKCIAADAVVCGSETCSYTAKKECTEDVCPYRPPPPVDCLRDDGRPCYNPTLGPLCLLPSEEENLRRKDYLSKFNYVDFSKFTFNKSKYLPASYLPGDGADFMYGYGLKPTAEEMNAGPCGSPTCPMASLDYLLDKLNKPMDPLPSLRTAPNNNYCGGPACPRAGNHSQNQHYVFNKPTNASATCPFAMKEKHGDGCDSPTCPFSKKGKPKKEPCEAPDCPYRPKKEPCEAPDCPYRPKKEPCGAPDCPYRPKKPCGAPDCKYDEQQERETPCPYFAEESKPKKKKKKHKRDNDSIESCDSKICPFAGMQHSTSEESGVSCGNPECPFSKKLNEECYDKNCPYAKELVICQDCGGVILEDIDLTSPDGTQIQDEKSGAFKSSVEIFEKLKKPSASKNVEKEESEKETKDRRLSIATPEVKPANEEKEKSKSKKAKHKETLYTYPGVKIGHRTCMKRRKNIPANMGWLWNTKPEVGNPDLWRGYKPGAVDRTVHKMIREHRRALGIYDPSEMPKKKKSKTSTKQADKLKRVIEVKKKSGNFFVTINPVKDPTTLEDFESPYVECTPIQFKIIKPVDESKTKPKEYDENGCYCDEDESIASSSDLSELDFNFSPPAGIQDLRPRKKKIKHTMDTQYDAKDCGGVKSALKKTMSSGGVKKKGKKKK